MTGEGVTRRQLAVVGAGAVLALAGCSASPPRSNVSRVSDLTGTRPFYIAHRGSGDNWNEHTAEAYAESVAHGVKAIEVSVQSTRDGVLVCHHDPTTLRLTGEDLKITDISYARLSTLRTDARQWLGPKAPLLPIPRLKDVLDTYAATHIIFIEDKTGNNFDPITTMLNGYPNATEHFVWKQIATVSSYRRAAAMGFKTWGYFTPEMYPLFESHARNFDFTGIYYTASDNDVRELVALGKPVICWEVHNRSTRDRMAALGVPIMMCSNVLYVMSEKAVSTGDAFSTGLRAPGDLPASLDQGWNGQPTIQPESGSLKIDTPYSSSYVMGSMSPIGRGGYTLAFALRWPSTLPGMDQHAGIAFGQENDAAYRVLVPSSVGGYHMVVRPSGAMQLYRREPGEASGTLLSSVVTAAARPGEWMRFRVSVSESKIAVARTDVSGAVCETSDKSYRGQYFSLCKNYGGGSAVEFKEVMVS